MPQNQFWQDDRAIDTPFSRRRADVRASRTGMPAVTQNRLGSLIGGNLGGGSNSMDSSSRHYAIPVTGTPSTEFGTPSWSPENAQAAPDMMPQSERPFDPRLPFMGNPAHTELVISEEEAEYLVLRDRTTGLYNAKHIARVLAHEVERAKVFDRTVSAVVISIDNFQRLGVTYGAIALDKVIESVGALLGVAFRSIDTIGRISENRFAIICPEMPKEELLARCRNVASACAAINVQHYWHKFNFTVSVGATISTELDALSLLALTELLADDATASTNNCIRYEDTTQLTLSQRHSEETHSIDSSR